MTPLRPSQAAPLSVVAALGVAQIIGWGGSYYLLAVLAEPIARDTGWSLDWVVAGVSLGLLVSGLVARRVGTAITRVGGRPVLAAGSTLLAGGLSVVALSPDIVVYLVGWFVIGCGMGAALYDAAFSSLGRLYGGGARRAITRLTLVAGFASTLSWPLSALLVESVGWRGTCLTYAGLQIVIALPLHLWGIPREPGRRSDAAARATETAVTMTARQRAAFLLLAAILTASGLVMSLWSVHLVTILRDGGLDLAAAVSLAALIGPAQVGGRLIEMGFGERHHPIRTLVAAAALIAAGMALLWADPATAGQRSPGLLVPGLALVCYGAGNGIWSIARGTLPLTLFGAAGYPLVMGRLAAPNLIVQAAAPSVGALLIGAVGGEGTLAVLTALASANLFAVCLLWGMIRRPVA